MVIVRTIVPIWKQMIVSAILDGSGRPICCELWPGNVTDVSTLIPIIERLKTRFGIESVCVVADRGMISATTIEQLESEELKMDYILGVRMRKVKEVRDEVLSSEDVFTTVTGKRLATKDPSPSRSENSGSKIGATSCAITKNRHARI